jgi:hypothetical protein
MGSGFYPLQRISESGKELIEIRNKLRQFIDKDGNQSFYNDQIDNAASDGGYETYLHLALELIERCLEPERIKI